MYMPQKDVVIVVTNFANGGAERRAVVLANAFLKNGYRVTYFVLNKIYSDVVYELNDRIEFVSFLDFKKSNVAEDEKRQADIWKKKRLNIIRKTHRVAKIFKYNDVKTKRLKSTLDISASLRAFALCKPGATFICFGINAYENLCYAIKGLNNKIVFAEIHSPDFKENKEQMQFYNKVLFYLIKKADSCVFQTEQQKAYYGICVKSNGIVIKNPLSLSLPQMHVGDRQHKIVNFCRTHPVKNLVLLVDAFSRFSCEYPDYTLHIYGSASTQTAEKYKLEVVKHIYDLGVEEKVKIYEAIPDIHQQVVDYSMFISSSDSEGLSNSMLEAMAIGLPCICTDCVGGGAREMIKDGENGLLVPIKDVDALYQAMCRMVSEEGLAERCSRNAYKVREELSVDNIVKQWIEIIESL